MKKKKRPLAGSSDGIVFQPEEEFVQRQLKSPNWLAPHGYGSLSRELPCKLNRGKLEEDWK